MKCNCKIELEKELTKRYEDAAPDATGHKVTLDGYGFGIRDNKMILQGYMKYISFAFVPLKDGRKKPKKKTGNMIFSYCPFCGTKVTGEGEKT